MIPRPPATFALPLQFLRFLAANTVAALANIASRWAASFVLHDAAAILIGFATGLFSSYLLCRSFVFQPSSTSLPGEMLRFTAVNIMALGIIYATYYQMLIVLRTAAAMAPESRSTQTLAHSIAVASPVLFSFFAQRRITFRQHRTRNRKDRHG